MDVCSGVMSGLLCSVISEEVRAFMHAPGVGGKLNVLVEGRIVGWVEG